MTALRTIVARRAAVPVVVVAAASLLAACASTSPTPAHLSSSKSTVTFALSGDPTCLDPQQTTLTTALNVGRQVVDSLVDQNPKTGKLVPWLAISFTPNSDLTAYTFKLRDDVTFSDGSKLTPEVVKDNFDQLSKLASSGSTASLAGQYLSGYSGTQVLDKDSVKVSFSTPNAPFLQGTSTMTLGIVSDATTKMTAAERCTKGVIGSGPFQYASYTPNDSVVLTARAGYGWPSSLREHTGDALVKKIEFPIVADASVRTGGLASGQYDIIQDVPFADQPRFSGAQYHLYSRPNTGVATSLIPNTTHAIVGDDAVRKAILLGTDRDEINALTGATGTKPADSPLTSSTLDYASQAKAMAYAPDKAKKLLTAAGWIPGPDGIRVKDGQRLQVTVTAFYGQDVLETAQMELKKIGIDLQIKITDAGGFFGAIASGNYDFLAAGLTRTDPDALRVLVSSAAKSHWAIVDDPELETVLSEQASEADPAKRADLIAQAQKIIVDKAYLIPLLQSVQLHASTSHVDGLAFDSASRINLYDLRITK